MPNPPHVPGDRPDGAPSPNDSTTAAGRAVRRAAWKAVAACLGRSGPRRRRPIRLDLEPMERRMMPSGGASHLILNAPTVGAPLGTPIVEGQKAALIGFDVDELWNPLGTDDKYGPGAFSVSIDWGDGNKPTPALGLVTYTAYGWDESFRGTYTYHDDSEPGHPYLVTVTLSGPNAPFGTESFPTWSTDHCAATIALDVQDAGLTVTAGTASTKENQSIRAPMLGTFQDQNPFGKLSDFAATYTYDGSDHAARIVPESGGTFQVWATGPLVFYHYNDGHPYIPGYTPPAIPPVPFSVHEVDSDPVANASGNFAVTVHDADLNAYANVPPHIDHAGETVTYDVGGFSDQNRDDKELIDEYTATIFWGDGTSSTGTAASGMIGAAAGGTYPIHGTHVYTRSGDYTVQIHVVSLGGSEAWASRSPYHVPPPRDSVTLLGAPPGEDVLPVVEAGAELFQGAVRLREPLDFDQSPGTAVGRSPALVYNSITVQPDPIVRFVFRRDHFPLGGVTLTAKLYWDGLLDQTATFTLPDDTNPGTTDEYQIALQLINPVVTNGLHTYSVDTTAVYSGGSTAATAAFDTYPVVVTDKSPYGPGWLLDGIDQLVPDAASGAVMWQSPSGRGRVFRDGTPNLLSPPGDYGVLAHTGTTYAYTDTHGVVEQFDADGYLTRVVDPHGVAVTYAYDGNHHLTSVATPDGAFTTLAYAGTPAVLTSIDEPGGRTFTPTISGGVLASVTDVDGTTRTFSYGTYQRLTGDQWGPVSANFSFSPSGAAGRLSGLDFGAGTTYALAPAEVRQVGQVIALHDMSVHGSALWDEPISGRSTFAYTQQGWRSELDTPDGRTQTWDRAADGSGLVEGYTDKAGRQTVYGYDTRGNTTMAAFPDGTSQAFAYHPTFNYLTQSTDEDLNSWAYQYNATGDRTVSTDPLNESTTYTYDSTGLLLAAEDPRHYLTSYSYDLQRRLTQTEDPLHRLSLVTYDPTGNPATTTDGAGDLTTTAYDARNRLTDVQAGLSTNHTTYAYDAAGDLTAQTDPNGRVTGYGYDGRLLRVSVTEAAGTPAQAVTSSAYDTDLRLTQVTDANTHSTTFAYDRAGNATAQTDALGHPRTMAYDPVGNLTAVTDETGFTTSYLYDARNRRTELIDPLSRHTTTVYDPAGRVTELVDALGNSTDSAFDADGRPTTTTDALLNTGTQTYDDAGNLVTSSDRNGNVTTYAYDQANQRTQVSDPAGGLTGYVFDLAGRMTQVNEPLSRYVTYGYDPAGRRTSVTDELGRQTLTTFDSAGNPTQVQDPRGFLTTTLYDLRNRATTVIDPLSHRTTTAYDGVGNVTAVSSPGASGAAAAQVNQSEFDPANRRTAAVDALGVRTTYLYDLAGRLTEVRDKQAHPTTYVYDAAGQQTVVVSPVSARTTSAYDQAGNRTLVTDADSHPTTYTFDALRRLASTEDAAHDVTNYEFDRNGNQTAVRDPLSARSTVAFDPLNRQTAATDAITRTSSNAYDPAGRLTLEVMPGGGTTTYVYDAANERTTRIDAEGHPTTYTYDPAGNQTTVADALGRTTETDYDQLNRATLVTDPLSQTAQTVFDSAGNRWATETPRGSGDPHRWTTFGYDPLNRQTTVQDPLNRLTTTAYDAMSRTTQTAAPASPAESFAFDAAGRKTAAQVAGMGPRSFVYDPADNLTVQTDEDGRPTTFAYDAADRQILISKPLGGMITLAYDADGQLTFQADRFGQAVTMAYDDAGELTSRLVGGLMSRFQYDLDGNQSTAIDQNSYWTNSAFDLLDRRTTMSVDGVPKDVMGYDAAGEMTAETNGDGQETDTAYDRLGRATLVTDPLSHTNQTRYDAAGEVIATADGASVWTTYGFDLAGRQTLVQDPDGARTTTALDQADRATQVQEANGNGYASYYDSDGNLTLTVDANSARTTYLYDDWDGTLTAVIDRNGRERDYQYDADGRVSVETWNPAGPLTTEYVTYTYDGDGSLLSVANGNGVMSYAYDSDGRVTAETQATGFVITYTLDGDGNASEVVDSLGGTTTSTYDDNGQLLTRAVSDGTNSVEFDVSWDGDGNILAVDRGQSFHRARTSYAYDAAGRVTYIGTEARPYFFWSQVAAVRYGYDTADRVTWVGNVSSATEATYAYDAASQVTNDSGTAHGYDSLGNRTDTGYSTGTGNRLSTDGTWTYTYDGEGNRTAMTKAGEAWDFTYDNANRMVQAVHWVGTVSVEQVQYAYDATGRRIARSDLAGSTLTTQVYDYDGQNAVVDQDGTGAVTARRAYLDGQDQLVARLTGTATVDWYAPDRLGSVLRIELGDGTAVDTLGYDAYGQFTETAHPVGDRYKFTAQEWDTSVGAYFYNARLYDPSVGRFYSEDPTGFNAGDPNLYRYVGNDPTNGTDPTGQYIVFKTKKVADAWSAWLSRTDHGDGLKAVPNQMIPYGSEDDDGRYLLWILGDQKEDFDRLMSAYYSPDNPGDAAHWHDIVFNPKKHFEIRQPPSDGSFVDRYEVSLSDSTVWSSAAKYFKKITDRNSKLLAGYNGPRPDNRPSIGQPGSYTPPSTWTPEMAAYVAQKLGQNNPGITPAQVLAAGAHEDAKDDMVRGWQNVAGGHLRDGSASDMSYAAALANQELHPGLLNNAIVWSHPSSDFVEGLHALGGGIAFPYAMRDSINSSFCGNAPLSRAVPERLVDYPNAWSSGPSSSAFPERPVDAATATSPYAHLRSGWMKHIDSVVEGLVAKGRPKTMVLGAPENGQGNIRRFVTKEPSQMSEFLEYRPDSLDYSAHKKAGTFTQAMDDETLEFNLLLIERLHQRGFTFKVIAPQSPRAVDSKWLRAELGVLFRLRANYETIPQARYEEVLGLPDTAKWRPR